MTGIPPVLIQEMESLRQIIQEDAFEVGHGPQIWQPFAEHVGKFDREASGNSAKIWVRICASGIVPVIIDGVLMTMRKDREV